MENKLVINKVTSLDKVSDSSLKEKVSYLVSSNFKGNFDITDNKVEDQNGEEYNLVIVNIKATEEEFKRVKRLVMYQVNKTIEIGDKVIFVRKDF